MITRISGDDNDSFSMSRNGLPLSDWFCEREHLGGGKRGNWILFRRTLAGMLEADRDQYSNDIIERLDIYLQDPDRKAPRPTYGMRFKCMCAKAEYLERRPTWVADLEYQFGGTWSADYHEWEGKAVLFMVFAPAQVAE